MHHTSPTIDVIIGNSNPRFSGVTSTMLQTLGIQKDLIGLKVMGKHHLPDAQLAISFIETIKLCRQPLPNGKPRIFHARRNDEMIQALLLKHIFRCHLRILFTSTAQRHHSGFSRWLMRNMDAVISTCNAAASYLKKPASSIIPHGVDTQVWQPVEDKSASWMKLSQELGCDGRYGIGIFGRVREQKGVHLFVRACINTFAQQTDYTAIISGAISNDNQAFVEQLKKEIADAGLQTRILFLGEQPFEKIPVLMRSVSLVAALSDNEGFGLTPLEAMASGTAVLCTKAGAWPEIIKNGVNGYIEEVNDQQAISLRLQQMLLSHQSLKTMGENGRQQVLQNFTVAQEAQKLCQFYTQLQQR